MTLRSGLIAAFLVGTLGFVIAYLLYRSQTSSPSTELTPDETGISVGGITLQKMQLKGWHSWKVAEYLSAAAKFPSAKSCLVGDHYKASLLTVDWYKIGSTVDAEVCLSRIARVLGTPRKTANWLKVHGFTVSSIGSSDNYGYFDENYKPLTGTVIDASWSIKRNGALYRGDVVGLLSQSLFGHGVGTQFFFRESDNSISVNVTTTYL
jgi:hypothetical protein